jgi:hypothetical protein
MQTTQTSQPQNSALLIQDRDSLNSAFLGVLTLAREVGVNSAFRLLELRGGVFCPQDQSLIELELRDYFVNSDMPALLALDGQTLSILYGLAARAAMHRALEVEHAHRAFRVQAQAIVSQEEA